MTWLKFHYDSIYTFSMLLILSIFTIYLASVKHKIKSTYFLIGFLLGNILYLFYLLVSYGIDLPITAYIKALLLIFSSCNFIFLALFVSYYHKNIWPLESKIFFISTLIYCGSIILPFLYIFLKLPLVYSFGLVPGYELAVPESLGIFYIISNTVYNFGLFIYIWAIIILLRKAIYIEIHADNNTTGNQEGIGQDTKILTKNIFFTHFPRLFTLTNKQASACRSFAICLLSYFSWFILLGYSVTNPDTTIHPFFQLVLGYFPVITWLFFILIYLNNSTDTSSFAIKLISFSIILPLIAISLLSSSFLIDHKKHYLQLQAITINALQSKIVNNQIPEYPGDLAYIVKKELDNDSEKILFNRRPGENIVIQKKQDNFQGNSISAEKTLHAYLPDSRETKTYIYGFKSIKNEKNIQRYLYFYYEDDKTRYEFGFNYTHYLDNMHSGTNVCLIFILTTTLILLFTLTFFIHFIIQKPIKKLLAGVDDVMKGNLDVTLDITNNDEIGTITHSFNVMILSLKESHIQLKEYSTNLEKTVEKRTEKIKENAQQLKQMNSELQKEINERKKIQKQLEYNVLHDHLTGLANRTLLFDHLTFVINQQERKDHKELFALFFMDIDRFKMINDSLGHEFGDHLLMEIGNRLAGYLRKQDTIARIGGDEFIILLPEVSDVYNVRHCAERILDIVKRPYKHDNKELIVTASIGVALSSQGYTNPEDMIRDSDIAMYKAKKWGRNRYAFFDTKMHKKVAEEQQLESALHIAVKNHDFSLAFQPIINLRTGEPDSFEALIRWSDPQGNNIPPCHFIPLAEETGLILPMGNFVLEKAIKTCIQWQMKGYTDICISINCSTKQFLHSTFHETISNLIKETGLSPEKLILEITETLFLDYNSEKIKKNLVSIKNMGVLIAMDDFGTGYSSLASLNILPIDILKIDRSVSLNIPGEESMCNVLRAIISLAQHINLKVVIEGIETQDQIDFLSSFQNVFIQGYYFSKPLPNDDVFTYLESKK